MFSGLCVWPFFISESAVIYFQPWRAKHTSERHWEIEKLQHVPSIMTSRIPNEIHVWNPLTARRSVCRYLARPLTRAVSNHAYVSNYCLDVSPLEAFLIQLIVYGI